MNTLFQISSTLGSSWLTKWAASRPPTLRTHATAQSTLCPKWAQASARQMCVQRGLAVRSVPVRACLPVPTQAKLHACTGLGQAAGGTVPLQGTLHAQEAGQTEWACTAPTAQSPQQCTAPGIANTRKRTHTHTCTRTLTYTTHTGAHTRTKLPPLLPTFCGGPLHWVYTMCMCMCMCMCMPTPLHRPPPPPPPLRTCHSESLCRARRGPDRPSPRSCPLRRTPSHGWQAGTCAGRGAQAGVARRLAVCAVWPSCSWMPMHPTGERGNRQ